MAFTEKYDSGSDSSDEEMTDKKFAKTYKLLLTQWKEACMIVQKQKKTINTQLLEIHER